MLVSNKKAYFDYQILENFTTGIVLTGTEIKSIRIGEVNLRDSFCMVENREIFAKNIHISPYKQGSYNNHDPLRVRKLLLKKTEIKRIHTKVKEKGLTLVPLKIFINEKGLCKMEIGLVKGKKQYDKRESIKKRDLERERSREE